MDNPRIPLADVLGLDAAGMAAARQLLHEAVSAHGLDGAAIFDRLAEGQSVGEALAMPKGAVELLYGRAYQWFSIGRVEKAEPLFRALCVLESSSADYWVGYGICLRMRQEWAAAERCLATAIALRPSWSVPHFHALELFVRQQDWPRAKLELLAFEQRAGADTPDAMRQEAARFGAALALK